MGVGVGAKDSAVDDAFNSFNNSSTKPPLLSTSVEDVELGLKKGNEPASGEGAQSVSSTVGSDKLPHLVGVCAGGACLLGLLAAVAHGGRGVAAAQQPPNPRVGRRRWSCGRRPVCCSRAFACTQHGVRLHTLARSCAHVGEAPVAGAHGAAHPAACAQGTWQLLKKYPCSLLLAPSILFVLVVALCVFGVVFAVDKEVRARGGVCRRPTGHCVHAR